MNRIPKNNLEMFNGIEYSVHHSPEMRELEVSFYRKLKNVYSLTANNGRRLFIAIECNKIEQIGDNILMKASEHETDDFVSWIRLEYPSCNI